MRPLPPFAILLLTFAILPPPARADKPADFFQTTSLHAIHIRLSEQAFTDIQPRRNNPLTQLFAATRPADAETEHTSPFGYSFTYVRADIDIDNTSLKNIGARHKGNSSFMTGKGLKKPYKLDFDHYAEQEFLGLKQLNLHNNAIDPTLIRESLSYHIFRACGVPAPRTSFALVHLTVDKQHDKRLLGLYTTVEEVDKRFLKSRFGSTRGLLLKPEGAFNLPFMGESWDRYEKTYRPRSDPDPALQQRLIDFLKLVHQADDAAFERQLDSFLEINSFYRFIAANALMANMDSFLTTGHNFYLYIHPKSGKIHFVPWDLNLSLAGFDWVGGIHDQLDLSYRQPWIAPNRLLERLMRVPRFASAYRDVVDKLTREVFTPDKLNPVIEAHYKLLNDAEQQAGLPKTQRPTQPNNPAFDFKTFVAQRQANLQKQLTTEHTGYAPFWQKGPFGRRPRPATGPASKPATQPTSRPLNQ